MKIQRALWPILASTWLVGAAQGVLSVNDGTDKAFWRNHAVVVCKVEKVVSDGQGDSAEVRLLAVVATDFLVPVSMTVDRIPSGAPDSAIEVHLPKGEFVVLCVERTRNGWTLPGDGLAFFPSNSAIQQLKGLEDPVLGRVVENVQKVRSKSK